MKKSNEISNIKKIILTKNDFCYVKDNILHFSNFQLNINKEDRISENNKNLYKYSKNELFILKDYKFSFWDKDFTSGCRFYKDTIISLQMLLKENKMKYHIKNSFIDKIFEIDGKKAVIYFIDNIMILHDYLEKTKIYAYNIFDLKFEWHFTLPEGFTVMNPIQVVEDVLFFKASKGGNNFKNVYGLDIKTGKILWEQHFEVPYKQNNIASLINPKNNLCYGYAANLYQAFNPVSGKMVFEKDMSEYYKQGIDPFLSRNFIHDNMLYFVSGFDDNNKFGALNLDTSEIEFVHDYPFPKGGQFFKIIYHNKKLYLLDSNNVLHIFEDL